MIEFYIDKFSYKSDEKIYFYISNSSPNRSINITILDFKKNIILQSSCFAGKQPTPPFSFAEGCNWKNDYILSLSQIDFDIKLPNIYFVKLENNENEKYFSTFIIKRNIYSKAVVCNTNTWCAYNKYGGASFYFPRSHDQKHRNLLLSVATGTIPGSQLPCFSGAKLEAVMNALGDGFNSVSAKKVR